MGLTTPEEYASAIRRETGYTEREAAFVYAAAVHSGAFVTRQFVTFASATQGAAVDQFIRKGTSWRHFSALPTRNATRVYQVCKAVYGILGEPDNRNRRPKQAALQRLRLMSLDYVVAHPDKSFLATEADKLEYLCGLGATPSVCPSRTYAATNLNPSVPPTTRYFIEKFPIFKCGQGAGFAFICENSIQTFESFLDRYLPLAVSLPEAEIVYVTSNPLIVKSAEATFHARLSNQTAASVDWATFELEFRERKALEEKGFELATTDELKRLRALRLKNYANLYPTWQAKGVAGIERLLGKIPSRRSGSTQFSVHVMADNYRFL